MSGHAFNDTLKFVLSDNTLVISSRITFSDNISSILHMHEEKLRKWDYLIGLFFRLSNIQF